MMMRCGWSLNGVLPELVSSVAMHNGNDDGQIFDYHCGYRWLRTNSCSSSSVSFLFH
jgi:hypothetical protein